MLLLTDSSRVSKLRSVYLLTILFTGSYAGPIIGFPLCGFIAHYVGWEYIFYISGSVVSHNNMFHALHNILSSIFCATKCTRGEDKIYTNLIHLFA